MSKWGQRWPRLVVHSFAKSPWSCVHLKCTIDNNNYTITGGYCGRSRQMVRSKYGLFTKGVTKHATATPLTLYRFGLSGPINSATKACVLRPCLGAVYRGSQAYIVHTHFRIVLRDTKVYLPTEDRKHGMWSFTTSSNHSKYYCKILL